MSRLLHRLSGGGLDDRVGLMLDAAGSYQPAFPMMSVWSVSAALFFYVEATMIPAEG
jgi:hypothetical protein